MFSRFFRTSVLLYNYCFDAHTHQGFNAYAIKKQNHRLISSYRKVNLYKNNVSYLTGYQTIPPRIHISYFILFSSYVL